MKNKKGFKSLFLAGILLSNISVGTVLAEESHVVKVQIGSIGANINGEYYELDIAPYVSNENTMIPLRFLANALNIPDENIGFDNNSKIVSIIQNYSNTEIQFQINNGTIITNYDGFIVERVMDNYAKAEIVDSRTFVPLREIANAFNLGIDWNPDNKLITLTSNKNNFSTTNARVLEEEVIRLVNIERVNYGLNPLSIYEPIMDLARAKSQDMVSNDYFSHEDPNGKYLSQDLVSFGDFFSENIAQGQSNPAILVSSWLEFPEHKSNILNPDYTHIGVGFANFTWTQMFLGGIKPVDDIYSNATPALNHLLSETDMENLQSINIREFEEEVVRLTNIEREKVNAEPLTIYEPAMNLAREKSQDMVDNDYFSHADLEGEYLFYDLKEYTSSLGENIAFAQTTPEEVIEKWLSQPNYRDNILDTDYKYIGVGFVDYVWTQMFLGELMR